MLHKNLIRMFAAGCAFAVLFPVSPVLAQDVTVTGVVEVSESDDDSNVLSVAIIDEEDNYFVVAPDGKGGELKDLIGQEVTATGSVTNNDDETKTITVKAYSLHELEPGSPGDEDGEGDL